MPDAHGQIFRKFFACGKRYTTCTHVVGSRIQSVETGLGDNCSSRVWDPRDLSCLDEDWDERRGEELLEGEVVHHAMSADEVQKASGCSWF